MWSSDLLTSHTTCIQSGTYLQARIQKIFPGGGPSLTYNCGSAQIWKITNFFISSNIGDIKLCNSEKKSTADQKLDFIRWYHTYSLQVSIGKKQGKVNLICFFYVVSWIILKWQLTKFQYYFISTFCNIIKTI